uniref:Ubiquitin carboxyl-terminal hydrolase n=1 Tax=Amazona collaria TaxID=241587 RepID=A0A8B9GDF1_9PSIT
MAAAEGSGGGGGSSGGGGSGARPDMAVQRAELGPLLAMALMPGESWYLVDSRWFKQWKKYVGFDSWDMFGAGDLSLFPGPVDNSGLFGDPETQSLKEHLIDELDYVLVPAEAWNKLVMWYGCMDGQQPIVRKVVEYGLFVKHYKVEVYLLELKLCESSDPDNVISCHFSKADTVATIEKEMRKLFNIPAEKETRLWNRYMSNTYEQLCKLDSTVQDAGLYQGQVRGITFDSHVLLSLVSSAAASRTFTTSSKSSASSCSSLSATSVITNSGSSNSYGLNSSHLGRGGSGFVCNSYSCRDSVSLSQPGLCGLSNLGNTCFMNSALQCLSNTPPLTDYFLEDKYEAEINQNNPLGMRGEIAEAYAELIKQMWSGRQSHVAPRMFKTQVGRFAPQFSGYQQQDSQELLAFLLDGLHEDLNRVKKKPYLELKDASGRPDSAVAKEAWENHRLRNDSIIVDIFHGLFKSTLVCPKCSKVSVTFDPFCYLTLPLPLRRDRLMEVTLVYADPQRRPVQYRVVVPMMGAISDLCESLSRLSGAPAENMVVTDVYNHRFHKIFHMDEGLNHIMPKDDIFVRYVKLPLAEEYSAACTGKGTCNGSNGVVEGDIEEMEHQDGGEEGKDKLAEADACHSEGCMQVESARDLQPSRKQYFTFSLVNSSGTSEINSIVEGKILKLNAFSALAVDWDSDTRRLLFDEQEAQAFEKHESMLQPQKKKAVVALRDCIELFTTMETLGEHDPWYCPNCKKHQQATKKFDLWSLPRILVVHLKRFSYSRYWRDKLDTVVEFPVRGLDMSEFVCDPRAGSYVYDLIAVSNHYGAMGVGHYTAYAKNKVNDKWYYFDDSSVSTASEDQIVTKAAYVLFYQRRSSEEHTAPSPPQEDSTGEPGIGDDTWVFRGQK